VTGVSWYRGMGWALFSLSTSCATLVFFASPAQRSLYTTLVGYITMMLLFSRAEVARSRISKVP